MVTRHMVEIATDWTSAQNSITWIQSSDYYILWRNNWVGLKNIYTHIYVYISERNHIKQIKYVDEYDLVLDI